MWRASEAAGAASANFTSQSVAGGLWRRGAGSGFRFKRRRCRTDDYRPRFGPRAKILAKAVGAKIQPISEASKGTYDVLVNATPVGMYPKTDACLFMDRIPGGVVFDMVYNPREKG